MTSFQIMQSFAIHSSSNFNSLLSACHEQVTVVRSGNKLMTKHVFPPHVAHRLVGKTDNKHNIKIRFVNAITETKERACRDSNRIVSI